jgi:hypothetical protein
MIHLEMDQNKKPKRKDTHMENKNQTLAETLNEMHASIDKCMAAFAALIESVNTPVVADSDDLANKVTANLDTERIIDKVVAKISDDVDTSDIADRIADDFDTSNIESDVTDRLVDDIDKDDIENRVVEKIEDSIDKDDIKDDIAEKIAGRLTEKILHALRDEVNS